MTLGGFENDRDGLVSSTANLIPFDSTTQAAAALRIGSFATGRSRGPASLRTLALGWSTRDECPKDVTSAPVKTKPSGEADRGGVGEAFRGASGGILERILRRILRLDFVVSHPIFAGVFSESLDRLQRVQTKSSWEPVPWQRVRASVVGLEMPRILFRVYPSGSTGDFERRVAELVVGTLSDRQSPTAIKRWPRVGASSIGEYHNWGRV